MTRSGQPKANRALHYIRGVGCAPRPYAATTQGAWVQDDNLRQVSLDEHYDFERVAEPEALAAIACCAEKLAAAAQSTPQPEKHSQWEEPQWKHFFRNA